MPQRRRWQTLLPCSHPRISAPPEARFRARKESVVVVARTRATEGGSVYENTRYENERGGTRTNRDRAKGVVRFSELATRLRLFGGQSFELELLCGDAIDGFLQIVDLVLPEKPIHGYLP